jgi:hypothetical protein
VNVDRNIRLGVYILSILKVILCICALQFGNEKNLEKEHVVKENLIGRQHEKTANKFFFFKDRKVRAR